MPPRKFKLVPPPVSFDRLRAMERAMAMYILALKADRRRALLARPVRSPIKRAATIDADMANEIYLALRAFYNRMLDEKFKAERRPSRADRSDLIKARIVCDVLEMAAVTGAKIKVHEAVQAVFGFRKQLDDIDHAVRTFYNLKRVLATTHPLIESNAVAFVRAYQRVIREQKKVKAKRK